MHKKPYRINPYGFLSFFIYIHNRIKFIYLKNITVKSPLSLPILIWASSFSSLPLCQNGTYYSNIKSKYYCAANKVVPCTRTVTNRFKTNVICLARDTADKSSCSKNPTIIASQTLTAAVINLWKAIGNTICDNIRLKSFLSFLYLLTT